MKTITIHVAEDTYAAFQERARKGGASASELIREAMSEYAARHFPTGTSIFDHAPAKAGKAIRPLERDDDLLEEMLG
ncbi:MAG: CopG family transcriptional regulator [Spirochaetaceae bacterium]|nr:MAG: CopG family transcriptional regulator [Spirochaetaceae bacterium]